MNIRTADLDFLKQLNTMLSGYEEFDTENEKLGALIDRLEESRHVNNEKIKARVNARRKLDKNYARTKAVKRNVQS